ncbi:MAG: hypothetical protein ACR2KZ_14890 [Segetibacter sp.]
MIKVARLLLAFLLLTYAKADANDSCRILLNKRVIFKGEVEQQNAVAFLTASQLKKTDLITLEYYSEDDVKGWSRTFYLDAANDKTLKTIQLNKQSGSVCFNAFALKKMIQNREPVFIYTTSLPKDKKMAARIRVRSIFVCKIEWN